MCQCVCVSLFNFGELAPANERPKGEQAAVGGRMRVQQMSFLKLWLNFSNWNHVVFDVGKIFFNSGDEAIPGGNGRLYDRTEAAGATEAAAAVP